MVPDLIAYTQGKDGNLVNGFTLPRKASMSEVNLGTYPCDGSVPPELLDRCLNPRYPNNPRLRAVSSYTNDRREEEATNDDDDDIEEGCVDNRDLANGADEYARACIVELYAVIDSAEDTATSSQQRPSALRKMGDDFGIISLAAIETALRMGKAFPGGIDNILVVPHGNILSDSHNDVAGFVQLFPEGCSGPEDRARQRAISFQKWAKTLLNRRDDSWRKDLPLLRRRHYIQTRSAIQRAV